MKKNNNRRRVYFTTTLPYINARPHIGHAREFIQADVYNRFYRDLLGYETFLNIGTDEHGLKVFRKAEEKGKDVQKYCDEQAEHFKKLAEILRIDYTKFTRTTDKDHIKVAQDFWKVCDKSGYTYKKNYKVKYCVGCELEKTDSELVNGKCSDHPKQEIEIIDEENYFFKFSAFQEKLLEFYKNNPDFVKPSSRYKEIVSFIERGLEDFSISRLKEKMSWGIEVPGDSEQVMYVWFDALVNYISTIGWSSNFDSSDNKSEFEKWWPVIQFCGKDNLRQQTAMWQAMLMAAGLENSRRVYVNGFIVSDGQKMSKSIGNVIDPTEMVEKFGVDATRYLLLSIGSFGRDSDITWDKLTEKYNADLANGIGNLCSRVVTLYKKIEDKFEVDINTEFVETGLKPVSTGDCLGNREVLNNLKEGKLELEIERVMDFARGLDKTMEEEKPWELAKTNPEEFKNSLETLMQGLALISHRLKPFMPEISGKILDSIKTKEKMNLFPRAV